MAGGDQRPEEGLTDQPDEEDPWDKFGESLDNRFQRLEQRQEQLETMLASMMGGMGQLWAALEALISFVLEGKTEEEKEEWVASFAWFTNELWKQVKSSAVAGSAEPPA